MRNRDKRALVESASEAILPTNADISDVISSQISLNAKGEYDAIEGYEKLLSWFKDQGDEEAVEIINEIISDEKNHVTLLQKLLFKYDNILTAKD